jgi:hypothetical protein
VIAAQVVRAVVAAVAVTALAITGGLLGRTMAPQQQAHGPYTVDARLAVLAPGEVEARLAAPIDYGAGPVRLGVTPAFARDSALAMLEAASAALDPQGALPPPTVVPGPPDVCVIAGGGRPGGCPQGLNASVLPGEQVRLLAARAAGPAECEGVAVAVETADPADVTVTWWSEAEDIRSIGARTDAPVTCVVLPHLTPGARYEVHVAVGGQFRQFVLDSDGAALRPAAAVYAPTPDLIAVTVPHRPGESVRVFPNVLSGDEPRCDEVTIGYDLFVHPLGSVQATVPASVLEAARLDPAFTDRTTFAFDVGEGHTVFLCTVVTTVDGDEDYVAQTIIQTADRVTPVIRILQASVPDIPEWMVRTSLPDGQECGAWAPGGDPGDLIFGSGERPVLCDPTDELGSQVEGRGVLPFSTARPASLTVQLGSPQWGLHTASVDLGEGSRCTGFCAVPATSYAEVRDGRGGSVMLQLNWGQGSTNGAVATEVAALSDSLSVPLPGPQLDVATARSVVVSGDDQTRGVTANMYIRADEEVDYVAQLVPAAGEAACQRPGARLEVTGHLDEVRPVDEGIILPGEWSALGNLRFSGLCHGTVYQAIVELTDAGGRTTTWGAGGPATAWGASSRIAIPPLGLPVTVGFSLMGHEGGGAGYLTLFVDGVRVAGPAGSCIRDNQDADGSVQVQLLLGETSRLSGTISFQPADTSDRGCLPRPMDAAAAIPFAIDVGYDDLAGGAPFSMLIHDPGADPSADTVLAAITVSP